MAIIQSSLAEEILSKQERAVIRGIYRASQLNEALIVLQKSRESIKFIQSTNSVFDTKAYGTLQTQIDLLANYLCESMNVAFIATKVPASPAKQNLDSKSIKA